MMFFREITLLFKPIDTQTSFGIKIFKQSHSDTCLCFLSRRSAAFSAPSCLIDMITGMEVRRSFTKVKVLL